MRRSWWRAIVNEYAQRFQEIHGLNMQIHGSGGDRLVSQSWRGEGGAGRDFAGAVQDSNWLAIVAQTTGGMPEFALGPRRWRRRPKCWRWVGESYRKKEKRRQLQPGSAGGWRKY